MDYLLRERRLRWLGHVLRSDPQDTTRQCLMREIGLGSSWYKLVLGDLGAVGVSSFEMAERLAAESREMARHQQCSIRTWCSTSITGGGASPDRALLTTRHLRRFAAKRSAIPNEFTTTFRRSPTTSLYQEEPSPISRINTFFVVSSFNFRAKQYEDENRSD